MKEKLLLIVKGFIIGIANIIPGVSGGTLAITLGIYEKIINAVSHFFKDIKENIKFVLFLGIGALLSILLLSKGITFALDNYTFITKMFFIGLILGGLPMIYKNMKGTKKVTNYIILIITFGIVLLMTLSKAGTSEVSLANMDIIGYIVLFFVGMLASATMIIPGISGSFVLMLIGYYSPILKVISDLASFNNIWSNILILIPFGLGIIVGIVGVAKLIEYLLKKFKTKTYFGIMGFIVASVPCILIQAPSFKLDILSLILGIFTCLIGYIISMKLGEK